MLPQWAHLMPALLLCACRDLILSVGDWGFSLWKEGLQTPLFTSPSANVNLCGARWSPTRPAVVFIAKVDGTLDIWDLVDQTHKPSFTAPIVSIPITSMEFRPTNSSKSGRQGAQMLAAGDAMGNLHVLDVPPQLRYPTANEEVRTHTTTTTLSAVHLLTHPLTRPLSLLPPQPMMAAYLQREEDRVAYAEVRAGVRAKEKDAADAAAAIEESKQERIDALIAVSTIAQLAACLALGFVTGNGCVCVA